MFIKLANQALSGPSLFVRALFVLVVTNTLQIADAGRLPGLARAARIAQGVHHLAQFVLGRNAVGDGLGLLVHRLRAWRRSALVRSVGQIEIVFTLLFSRFYLKETLKPGDVAGLVLVVAGVLLIVVVS